MELAVSFVQAAAQYGTETILRTYDPNSLGLRDFMRKAEVKGMNNVDLLYVAFVGSSADTDEELRIIFDEELKRLRL